MVPSSGLLPRRLLASAAICLLAVACSEMPKAPDTGGSNAGDGERITGSERIGWLQSAPSRQALDSYEYAAYVDNQRVPMAKPSCAESSAGVFDCSAPLPSMTAGRHTLELIASAFGLDSERSPQLVVSVGTGVQSATPADEGTSPKEARNDSGEPAPPTRHCVEGSDECYDLELIADGLTDARSPLALPDERVLVVTEAARILSFGPEENSQLAVDDPCDPPATARITSLAADSDFANSKRLFVAWHCLAERAGTQLLIVRYREVNGVLGEAAVVYGQAVRPGTASRITVASDRTLFIAAAGRGSWSVLRLNQDGGTPPGSRARSPVILNVPVVSGLSSDQVSGLTVLATDQGPLIAVRTTPRLVMTRVAADVSVGSPVAVAVTSLPSPREPGPVLVLVGGDAGLNRLWIPGNSRPWAAGGVDTGDLGDMTGVADLGRAADGAVVVLRPRLRDPADTMAVLRLRRLR